MIRPRLRPSLRRIIRPRASVQLPGGVALSGAFANGIQGTAYSQTINITGGLAPYTPELMSGSLPPGITLQVVGTQVVISGNSN